MGARTLIADLARRGITLRVEGDRLIASPVASVSSEDADRIRGHKPALIDALTALPARRRPVQDCVTCGAALPPQAWARCPDCVDNAYRVRDERRRLEGRAPPADVAVPDHLDAHPLKEYPHHD